MKKKKVNAKVLPAPVMQIKITLYSNNSINVTGFPNDYNIASEIIEKAGRTTA